MFFLERYFSENVPLVTKKAVWTILPKIFWRILENSSPIAQKMNRFLTKKLNILLDTYIGLLTTLPKFFQQNQEHFSLNSEKIYKTFKCCS